MLLAICLTAAAAWGLLAVLVLALCCIAQHDDELMVAQLGALSAAHGPDVHVLAA